MYVWKLWMLCLAALLLLEGHCGLKIAGCENGSVNIGEGTSPSFTCDTFWSGSLEWSTSNDYDDQEDTVDIGFCDTEKCELQNNKFKLSLEKANGYRSVLTILEINRYTASRIICKNKKTEIQCRLKIIGLKISNCVNGSVDVVEDTSPSFTCGTFRKGWLDWFASEFRIGFCNEETCTPHNNQYKLRLERFSSAGYSSELTITKIDRYTDPILACVNYAARTTCSLRIFAPARIVPGKCSVTISNWRVQGSCQVENMFTFSDNYTCTWRENSVKRLQIRGDFQGHREYYLNLSRSYWKSVCSLSKLMPVDQNKFNYSIEIDPGSHDFFVETINIIHPRQPEHNCTDTVVEGSHVNCTCFSLNMGNPPANVVWDGKTDGILLLQDVQKEDGSNSYTCRLTWGPNGFINQTIVYTLTVVENAQASAANVKRWMIGGVVVAVIIFTIIGALIAVFIVKRQKVVNRSQNPTIRHAALSGDLHTVAMTTTSSEVHDGNVTFSQTIENTESDRVCNLQANQDITKTESRTKPTIKCQRTTAGGRNFSDLSGTVYMNVTEVPTDSGLGVYHIVPWAVMPAQHQPDTGASYEAVIFEEEYNVLQFEEDRIGQADPAAIYHHLDH